MDGGTWRRLKTAAELQAGHRLPRLPPGDKELLLGLLAAIEAGAGDAAVRDVDVQKEWSRRVEVGPSAIDDEILLRARRVDVRPFL